MKEMKREAFIGFDVARNSHTVAIAEGGRDGEVRSFGTISATNNAVQKLLKKLAARFDPLHVCHEAGPTGYGLYRQIKALGSDCCRRGN